MSSLADRFEAKVDRSGEHHLWTGSKKVDGSGKLKVDGRTVTAQRVAWELANGPLKEGIEVRACPEEKACVRLDHLGLRGEGVDSVAPRRRAAPGEGSMTRAGRHSWKVTVTLGRYEDGSIRREYATITADDEVDANRQKAGVVAALQNAPPPETREERDLTVDEAVDRYLKDHLQDEMGRAKRTIRGYRQVHDQWFSPEIGDRRLRDVELSAFRQILGRMRRAGLSHSRMNNAVSLYKPLFRWAAEKRYVRRSPIPERSSFPRATTSLGNAFRRRPISSVDSSLQRSRSCRTSRRS